MAEPTTPPNPEVTPAEGAPDFRKLRGAATPPVPQAMTPGGTPIGDALPPEVPPAALGGGGEGEGEGGKPPTPPAPAVPPAPTPPPATPPAPTPAPTPAPGEGGEPGGAPGEEPQPTPPAPPIPPATPGRFKGTPFEANLGDPKWVPRDWEELIGVLDNYYSFKDDQYQASRMALHDSWDKELNGLREGGIIPKVENPADDKDPGRVAEREIFHIAIEKGDPKTDTILPLKAAAEIWMLKKGQLAPQPPGASAPVSGAGGEPAAPKGPSYDEIRRGPRGILEAARERGELS